MSSYKKHILVADAAAEAAAVVGNKFAKLGWAVTRLAHSRAELWDKSDSISDNGLRQAYYCNMHDPASLAETVDLVERDNGPIHALFTATAFDLAESPDFLGASLEEWDKRIEEWVGFNTNICRVLASKMVDRQFGRILILTPDFKYVQGDCIIEATAAGVLHGFIKSFGVEVVLDNVNVNGLYANYPFDLNTLSDTAAYLIEEGEYISSQLISINGEAGGKK